MKNFQVKNVLELLAHLLFPPISIFKYGGIFTGILFLALFILAISLKIFAAQAGYILKTKFEITADNTNILCQNSITDDDLAWLKWSRNIKKTQIFGLRKISPLTNQITDRGLSHIKGMTELWSLNLPDCQKITSAGLANLEGMTQLKYLNLSGCGKITDEGLKSLEKLTKLQTLDLSGCRQITDAGLAHLKEMTELQTLNLKECGGITDHGLKNLAGMTHLRSLNLSECNIKGPGLAYLAWMTELQELNLAECLFLQDAVMPYIKTLSRLRTLDISAGVLITDAGLAHLEELPELKSLAMPNQKFAEKKLARAKNIRETNPLVRSIIFGQSDENANARADALENLAKAELRFGPSRMTDAGVEKLQKALPECEIIR